MALPRWTALLSLWNRKDLERRSPVTSAKFYLIISYVICIKFVKLIEKVNNRIIWYTNTLYYLLLFMSLFCISKKNSISLHPSSLFISKVVRFRKLTNKTYFIGTVKFSQTNFTSIKCLWNKEHDSWSKVSLGINTIEDDYRYYVLCKQNTRMWRSVETGEFVESRFSQPVT